LVSITASSLATKVANITIISTEVLQHNENLMEKQSQQHELNKDLREENIMLSKKVQGKPCKKATSFTLHCALMHPYSLLNQVNKLTSVLLRVCPVIDHKFRHHIVKVAVDPQGDSRVDPQTTLTML